MIHLIDLLMSQGVTLDNYKIHLATGTSPTPLDAYHEGWFKRWQEEQGKENFKCSMVIGLVHLDGDRWLFAGVYRVLGVKAGTNTRFRYDTELIDGQEDLVGRLIVRYRRQGRASYVWGHRFGHKLEVTRLLETPLSVEEFPGYNDAAISHRKLQLIVSMDEPSWKSALSHAKGIYLIIDTATGKPYVGMATAAGGLWHRWSQYAKTGHGGNQELRALLKEKGAKYAEHFRYSVLEIADSHATEERITAREVHWKNVLMSREFGYNSN